jgi:hypothetical protein
MTGGGSIIVVGSIAALTGHYPVAYTTSEREAGEPGERLDRVVAENLAHGELSGH